MFIAFLLISIVIFIFFVKSKSSITMVGYFFLAVFIAFICFLLCSIFGPVVSITYKSCIDKHVFKDTIYYTEYHQYDNIPYICFNKNTCSRNKTAQSQGEVTITGTIRKNYSFNAFVDSSSNVEIALNGKNFFISKYAYFDLLEQKLGSSSDIPVCSPFSILLNGNNH